MTSHTGTRDKDYNLISVLYHALSGADSCQTYLADAENESDRELTEFFSEAREQYRSLAEKAKQLCASRLQ
jgi:hypothetical protein